MLSDSGYFSLSSYTTGFNEAAGPELKKKDLYLGLYCLNKGLVYRISVLVPGHSTVLTESKSAISPADNYSPLLNDKNNTKKIVVNLVPANFSHQNS